MAIRVGGLKVDLALQTAEFVKGAEVARKQLNTLNRSLQSFRREFESGVKPLSTFINHTKAIVGAVGGVYALTRGFTALKSALIKAREVEDLRGGFEALSNTIGNLAGDKLQSLKAATQGLTSELDLMRAANQAVLLGVDDGSGKFEQMAAAAVKLGNAMGITTTEALNSLVVGIGRQSKLMLDNLGIIVNTEQAYKNFANANDLVASKLTESQKKLAFQEEAVRKINLAVNALPASAQTAANAFERLTTRLEDAASSFSIGVSSSDKLKYALEALNINLGEIDFEGVGKAAGDMAASLVNLINEVTQLAEALYSPIGQLKEFKQYLIDIGALNGISVQEKAATNLSNAIKKGTSIAEAYELPKTQEEADRTIKRLSALQKQLAELDTAGDPKLLDQRFQAMSSIGQAIARLTVQAKGLPESEDAIRSLGEEGAKAAEKAAKALEGLNKQLSDFKRDSFGADLRKQLDEAISTGNGASFDSLKQQIVQNTKDGVLEGIDESLRNSPAAQELADLKAKEEIKAIDGEIKDAMISMHQESVQAWQSFFENAITGVKFDFEDMFKQVAVGFAAEIAANLTKGISTGLDFSSPQGLGASIASQFGSLLSSGPGGILELFQLQSGALAGPMTEAQSSLSALAGSAGIAAAALGGAALTFKGIKDALSGKEDNSALGLSSRGQAAITTGGFSEVARLFGSGSDPGLKARSDFVDKLNELIKNAKGVTIFGSDGVFNLDQLDVMGGKDKFDSGKGFDFLNSLSGQAQGTFKALGSAFKEMFDLADADAIQLGAILAENLLGNIDNARLLVQRLGLSFEELKAKVLDTALNGEISWLEFNTTVAGLNDAFQPGLVALADISTALQNLRNSGGRGFEAVKSVRDLAQESFEAGNRTLEQFKESLIANGASVEEAQQIIEAAAGRGITDIEGLANASDELAGSITGDLQAMGFGFKELSGEVATVRDLMQQIDDFEFETKTVQVNVEVNDPTGELPGSSVSSPSGATPPSSPEGARSFSRLGNLGRGFNLDSFTPSAMNLRGAGVSGRSNRGSVINIDARNADPGVEPRLRSMISMLEERISNNVIGRVVDARNRGYL